MNNFNQMNSHWQGPPGFHRNEPPHRQHMEAWQKEHYRQPQHRLEPIPPWQFHQQHPITLYPTRPPFFEFTTRQYHHIPYNINPRPIRFQYLEPEQRTSGKVLPQSEQVTRIPVSSPTPEEITERIQNETKRDLLLLSTQFRNFFMNETILGYQKMIGSVMKSNYNPNYSDTIYQNEQIRVRQLQQGNDNVNANKYSKSEIRGCQNQK